MVSQSNTASTPCIAIKVTIIPLSLFTALPAANHLLLNYLFISFLAMSSSTALSTANPSGTQSQLGLTTPFIQGLACSGTTICSRAVENGGLAVTPFFLFLVIGVPLIFIALAVSCCIGGFCIHIRSKREPESMALQRL